MLQKYTERWVEDFYKERTFLESVFGKSLISVHHIGSTAIRDMYAKPQIDIAIELHDLSASRILQKYGYIFKGEFNIPFRFFFSRKGEVSVNLHIMLKGNHELDNFLVFRDYLNTHKKDRELYIDVKQKNKHLFNENAGDFMFNRYTLSKDDVIRDIIRKSGFNKICMRKVAHYVDFSYEKHIIEKYDLKIDIDAVRCVLYKGADIIGYSLAKNSNLLFMKAEDKYDEFFEYFLRYIQYRLELNEFCGVYL